MKNKNVVNVNTDICTSQWYFQQKSSFVDDFF